MNNKQKKGVLVTSFVVFLVFFATIPTVLAGWDYVEWEGVVTNDWDDEVNNAKVELKRGSTVVRRDYTNSDGEYSIRAYVYSGYYYTLTASKTNYVKDGPKHAVSIPLAGEPWIINFNIQYVDKYAVIVGINDYSHSSFLILDFAENDADDWTDLLTNDLGFDHVEQYEDDSGSNQAQENIVTDALEEMANNANAGDIVVFIFSGHGYRDGGDYALCMWDAKEGGEEDGYLYDTELKNIFNNCEAARIFFFFDCCNSYGMSFDFDDWGCKDNVYLSAACGSHQEAWETTEFDNGCWTYCFVDHGSSGATAVETVCYEASTDFVEYANYGIPGYYTEYQTPCSWDGHYSSFYLSKRDINPT